MNDRLFERIYRRLLREGGAPEVGDDLALCVQAEHDGSGQNYMAVLYDRVGLGGELKAFYEESKDSAGSESIERHCKTVVYDYIRAMIVVQRPQHPCAGAWEVRNIAGPGYGKIIYGVGYALSPNGILMSDRKSVSDDAYVGWRGVWRNQPGRAIDLDDVSSKVKRTEDPSDDCSLHSDGDEDCGGRSTDPLNHAYRAEGWEKGVLSELKKRHQDFLQDAEAWGVSEALFHKRLHADAIKFFFYHDDG